MDLHGRNRPAMKEATMELEWIRGTELAGIEDVYSAYYSLPIDISEEEEEEDQSWDGSSASYSLPHVSSQRYSANSESVHILA